MQHPHPLPGAEIGGKAVGNERATVEFYLQVDESALEAFLRE